MKYVKTLKYILAGFILCLSAGSCTNWLSVDPEDQELEKQVYESETKIQQVLNGLYINMAEAALYGEVLTQETIEILGQQYAASWNYDHERTYFYQYSYADDKAKERIELIWAEMYKTIFQINVFIDKLENTQGVVSDSKKNLLLGEAYGLRAFFHMDLMRLFGPVYSKGDNQDAIPYYDDHGSKQPLLKAKEVMERIFIDIDKSLGLLANDPVRTEGVVHKLSQTDFYSSYRNRRMNYYAVSLLKARALMWKGGSENHMAAANLAKSLLAANEIPSKFPWVTRDEVISIEHKDRIYSNEVIFGIHSPQLYSVFSSGFSQGIGSPLSLLAKHQDNIIYLCEGNSNWTIFTDWRILNYISYKESPYICSYKFESPFRTTDFQYLQPLMRKSELYYIVAEVTEEAEWIDEVRTNRGLEELSAAYDLNEELTREYMKEFIGEGQLFYFYKRRNTSQIRSGTGGMVNMGDSQYVVPIPQKELDEHTKEQ